MRCSHSQKKGPGSGDGIIGDARMDSVVPKVKLKVGHGTIGYRTLWGRC